MAENLEKCKWCGQPAYGHGGYCGTTCTIAAAQEDPAYIHRRKIRFLFAAIGTIYGAILTYLDGSIGSHLPFYVSVGALTGWFAGFPLSGIMNYLNKRKTK